LAEALTRLTGTAPYAGADTNKHGVVGWDASVDFFTEGPALVNDSSLSRRDLESIAGNREASHDLANALESVDRNAETGMIDVHSNDLDVFWFT
jgi:hypothetical protein